MKKTYELLSSQVLSERFFKLHRHELRHSRFEGGWSEPIVRERLEAMSAASVLLYDPDEDAVVLVEQFRIGMMGVQDPPWSMETVSGYCDKAHERPEEVARREVVEETGCELMELTPIGSFFVSPGFSVEQIYLYVGRVDSRQANGIHGLPHEDEEIRVYVMPRQQAMDELFGRLDSTSILIAMQWLDRNLDSVLQQWGVSRSGGSVDHRHSN
jgi:ADP-ribose pyrophosphatase